MLPGRVPHSHAPARSKARSPPGPNRTAQTDQLLVVMGPPYANRQENSNSTVQFSDRRGRGAPPPWLHPSRHHRPTMAEIAGNTCRPVDGTARRRISAVRRCPRRACTWRIISVRHACRRRNRRGRSSRDGPREGSRVPGRTAMPGSVSVAHVGRARSRGAPVGTFGNNEAR